MPLSLATELFYGLPIPPKREMPPRDEILRMDRACRTIQHCYRRRYYMNAITTMVRYIPTCYECMTFVD